jgi:hypothetical protein
MASFRKSRPRAGKVTSAASFSGVSAKLRIGWGGRLRSSAELRRKRCPIGLSIVCQLALHDARQAVSHAGTGIERLGHRHERDRVGIEQLDELGEISERAGQPVASSVADALKVFGRNPARAAYPQRRSSNANSLWWRVLAGVDASCDVISNTWLAPGFRSSSPTTPATQSVSSTLLDARHRVAARGMASTDRRSLDLPRDRPSASRHGPARRFPRLACPKTFPWSAASL